MSSLGMPSNSSTPGLPLLEGIAATELVEDAFPGSTISRSLRLERINGHQLSHRVLSSDHSTSGHISKGLKQI